MALDDNGIAHVAYYDVSNGALKYANNTPELSPVVLMLVAGLPMGWMWWRRRLANRLA
ncbi:MAG: hypothetical protein PVH68_15615 [Armatimonadota bacterium]|jgi:hypothetical protein